jgi:hypothetical protein
MFRIRPEQFAVLQASQEAAFHERVADFLMRECPDARHTPRAELLLLVQGQIDQARYHGFRNEDHLATYTLTGWYLGADFDIRFPAAARMLGSSAYTLAQKAAWLGAWTTAMFSELEER